MLAKLSKWKSVLGLCLILNLMTSCESRPLEPISIVPDKLVEKQIETKFYNLCTSPILPIEFNSDVLTILPREDKINLVTLNCILAVKCGYALSYKDKCSTLLYPKHD